MRVTIPPFGAFRKKIMNSSHTQTPRTLKECQFAEGYYSASFKESPWETLAGYVLVVVIGLALAAVLFFGLSA
jgi:hypothetical protein